MEKTKSENLKLGFFVILGTVLLLVAIYLIGARQNMFGNTIKVSTVFKNVNGLQKGNNVRFSGINVGTVNELEIINDTTIKVYMALEKKIAEHIRKDAIASIGSDGLVGSMIVNIMPGKGKAGFVAQGDELKSDSKVTTEEVMGTLNKVGENADLLTEDLLKAIRSLNKGGGTLGRLLNDTLMGADLQRTIVNIKNTTEQAERTIRELNGMLEQINLRESTAGALLGDTISGGKMRNIIANLEISSIEIKKMAKDMNSVVGEISTGNGAINYLATDTTLVNTLEHTMQNVDQGMERFNQNMEALKHNFFFRGYFKKMERERKSEAEQNEE
jgi:phospholipid/cholesterol/gamma-HCH transport system substrate-binding protein